MKTYKSTIICLLTALLLVGCGEQPPEANDANCAPEMKLKILSSLMNEANRNTFIDDCQSHVMADQLTSGSFKKSPPGDY
jgi:entry exclusion lipoprotein TrbK